jgi:MOSC domain-containing protein YiiM
MKLTHILTGVATPLANAKAHGVTGIYKTAIAGPVEITLEGLSGDAICDVESHGGLDQAVYVFGEPDYAWWSAHLGRALEPGTFGENLLISGLHSAELNIGDVLRFGDGDVELQVTSPRIPCVTLAVRMGDPGFIKRFHAAERPGVYCRVLKPGSLSAGTAVTLLRYEKPTVGVIENFRDFLHPDKSGAFARRSLAAPVSIRERIEREQVVDGSAPGIPPAPLFRDPIYDGAADPTVIWDRGAQLWRMFYTNRRALAPGPGVGWVHGTDIGMAISKDGGRIWRYAGKLHGLDHEPGRNTLWAPEVIWHDGLYHMYLSYVPGVPTDWSGPRRIVHKTSPDLIHWRHKSVLTLSSDRVIDACVSRLPDGRWRMWYKDETHQSHTWAADSDNLYDWRVTGPVITDCAHEGPNVFAWRGAYWMIIDHWRGQGVYRSNDLEHWERQADILNTPGTRRDDGQIARHADVVVNGERAFVIYFTHPQRATGEDYAFDAVQPLSAKRSSIQIAELELVDGVLRCDRDKPFAVALG